MVFESYLLHAQTPQLPLIMQQRPDYTVCCFARCYVISFQKRTVKIRFNSLSSSDAILRHKTEPTLAQVIACCLVLSHAHHVSSGGNFEQHQIYFDRPSGGIVPSSGQFGSSCGLLSMFTPCKRLKPAWVYLSLNYTWHKFMTTDLIFAYNTCFLEKNRKRWEKKWSMPF